MSCKTWGAAIMLLLASWNARAYDFIITTANNHIYGIEIDQCSKTLLGSFGFISPALGDITYTPDGRLWGITTSGWLYELNLEFGFATLVSTLPTSFPNNFTRAMTADERGLIYIATGSGYFYTYDPASDDWNNLGLCDYGASGDLTYIDGQLIMADNDGQVILIDQENLANSAPLLELSLVNSVFGMVTTVEDCEAKGTYLCTAVETGIIYEIDFETGLTSQLCAIDEFINGAASEFEFLQAAPLEIYSIHTTDVDCNQPLGSIEVFVNGGTGALSYQFGQQNPQDSNTIAGLFPGTYPFNVTDAFGCSDAATVDILEIEPVPQLLQIEIENDTCGIGQGSINLVVENGTPPYAFSLDGGDPQSAPFFPNLMEGDYLLLISDSADCGFTQQVTIEGNPPLELQAEPLGCGPGRSSIVLEATGGSRGEVQFILESSPPKSSNVFQNLDAGEYIAIAIDDLGCTDRLTVTIPEAEPVEVSLEDSQVCGPGQNFIFTEAQNATAPITYYLNGVAEENGLFDNLSSGTFIIEAEDGRGCFSLPLRVELPNIAPLSVSVDITASATCGEPTGEAVLTTSGGTPPYEYAAGGVFQSSPVLQDFPVGTVSFELLDAEGCQLTATANIPSTCEIYIPNAFSPDGDQTNECFQLYSGQPFQIISYRIFNVWGQPIYEAKDFSSTDVEQFWDGRCKNELLNPGVFVYRVEVINFLGERESFIGDLTLKR